MTPPTAPPPRPPYDPRDWYWIVAGSVTQVYSSAARDFVPIAGAAYQAFLAAGKKPTKIGTDASLGEVLAPYTARPTPAGVANGYDDAVIRELETFKILRAFSLVMLDEINILRAQHALPERTVAQLKTAVRSKLGV